MATMIVGLHDGKETVRLAEIERPVPGRGDALIRVRASGICGSDLLMNADKTEPDTRPSGHEVAGEIVEVGAGVDSARIGERVAVDVLGHGKGCTRCYYCRMGQFRQCRDKAHQEGGGLGGFAQYMVRRAAGCYPMPDGLSWEEGALVEPLAVSVHALRRGQMRGGETVAVLGAGSIGLTAVAAARAFGAGKVFVTARHAQQADMAKRLGADDALPPEGAALADALARVTDGLGADLTIETVGGKSEATVVQAIDVTRMQGRIVVLGGFRAPLTVDWLPPLLKEQSIIFASCYSVLNGRHDYELAIDLLASGKAPLKHMVTHRFPLEDVQLAFETAYDKSVGSIKVQFHM